MRKLLGHYLCNISASCNFRLHILGYWHWCQSSEKHCWGKLQSPAELQTLGGKESRCQWNWRSEGWDEPELWLPSRFVLISRLLNPFYMHRLDPRQKSPKERQRGARQVHKFRLNWQNNPRFPHRRSLWGPGSDTHDEVSEGNTGSHQARRKTYILCITWAN